MAANKFATMLLRNTNKITLVLVYAILEWILIILLLLNSLFSFLILKFADYFGLKRPCVWCTRIDHIIEPGDSKNSLRDLVCEAHASEISKLGFCSTHRRLAESEYMCEDCSSSSQADYVKISKNFGFFPWMKRIGRIQDAHDMEIENEKESLSCSCCRVPLDSRFYPHCVLIKPSLSFLDYTKKQNLITEGGVDAEIEKGGHSDLIRLDFAVDQHEDERSTEENKRSHLVSDVDEGSGGRGEEDDDTCACSVCDNMKEIVDDHDYKLDLGTDKEQEAAEEQNLNIPKDDQSCDLSLIQISGTEEKSQGTSLQHLEFLIHGDDCRLIPIENHSQHVVDHGIDSNEDVILDFDMHAEAEAEPAIENWHTFGNTEALSSARESTEASTFNWLEPVEVNIREATSGFQEEENFEKNQEDSPKVDNVKANMERREEETCTNIISPASEEAAQIHGDEFDADVSIGTEIPEHELGNEYQSQDILLDSNQHECGHDKGEEEFVEFRTMVVEPKIPVENNHLSSLDINENENDKAPDTPTSENEDEKVPDTPASVENLHHLHKKLLLLERKESGTEDSLDGSVISDIDCGELTAEKLKSALKAERKALNTLYAELEEERSASAVAANQTMAMINRLQEEKAAMQMEALQYQRMMEEQSEYDQEALQLLNEIMVKREKENQELEKELEAYRWKVQEYETREKTLMSRRDCTIRSRTSSPSCSNAEDSDGLSIDLNHEAKEENGFYSHQESSSNENTPVDGVLYLEESLSNFEEERVSILEQLKVLEEKLVKLNYEEQHAFDNIKSTEHLCVENGNGFHDYEDDRGQVNGFANGHAKEINGKHHLGKNIMGPKAKRLLPLFDAIVDSEAEDGVFNGDENGLHFDSLQNGSEENVELEKEKLVIVEEIDNLYERLQALEADREFLKHCISSLRKGDKGLDLLQEILQHLRDLRSVELRVRNISDLAS
ncbi:myosin-binding protein 2-like [Prosopis cineraria]|uniref:myosin-binding protein 2-like n=1 Tax=Prosopis cineraria TaxID=364024 RepID=UPI00240F3E50|nr:myosin-binding protein 2-like [Prosopis cineraria]